MSPEEAASLSVPLNGGGTLEEQLTIAKDHIEELITDHRHFTARWLTKFKEVFGYNSDERTLAKIMANVFCLMLSLSDRAEFIANAVLTCVPILLSLCYPEERAASQDMLIYWPCYALVTLFDFVLRSIPAWYMLKLAFFGLFFLRPWRLALKIRLLLLLREMHLQSEAHTSQSSQNQQRHPPLPPSEVLSQLLTAASSSSQRAATPSTSTPPSVSPAAAPQHPAQPQNPPLTPEMISQLLAAAASTARPTADGGQRTPTTEELAALQRALAGALAGAGAAQPQNSTYIDLRPRSRTKLTNPAPSVYSDPKKNQENKK